MGTRRDFKLLIQKAIDKQQDEKQRMRAQAIADELAVDTIIATLQGIKTRLNSGRLTEQDIAVLWETFED